MIYFSCMKQLVEEPRESRQEKILGWFFKKNNKKEKKDGDEFIKSQLRDFVRFGGSLVVMKMGN